MDTNKKVSLEVTLMQVGQDANNKIFLNGMDITSGCRGIKIESRADFITQVTLDMLPGEVKVSTVAFLEAVKLGDVG